MKRITKSLQRIASELWNDKELVIEIKKANLNKEQLYNHLTSGRITLSEYLQAAN